MSAASIAAAAGAWTLSGDLNFDTAEATLAAAGASPLPESGVVACEGIVAVDSAALAVLLAIRRRAVAEGRSLAFRGVPKAIAALATLYGVEALISA